MVDHPDLCSEIKRDTAPISSQSSPKGNRTHRRGASFDFRSSQAFAPPQLKQPQRRHRRVVSWDSRASQNKTLSKPFDFSMLTVDNLRDFNPSSPLRDDPLNIESMEPLNPHPFHRTPVPVPSHHVDKMHRLKDVTPPTPTLPLLDGLRDHPFAPSLTLSKDGPLGPLSKELGAPLESTTLNHDDVSFFKELFSNDELECDKGLLDTFNVGDSSDPSSRTNQGFSSLASPRGEFMNCDSNSVVDELMCLAENVSVGGDVRSAPSQLPSVPEPAPLTLLQPISTTISPLASGAVNEHNFPRKLYRLLEDCESNPNYYGIVAWSDDGTAFSVLSKKQFVEFILPIYFDQTQYASFRRQLNMYNFVRQGNTTTYSNPYFIKGRKDLVDLIQRKSVNASKKD
ncbi:MAG: hypothetical protein SGILL_010302 [Bacillariaceae sp.]